MDARSLIIGLSLVMASLSVRADHHGFSLYTFLAPPYQYEEPQIPVVTGETTETIRCALNKSGFQARISLMPQSRARYSLERNLVDGYYAVGASEELDQSAVRSHPVALEKWHWFFTAEAKPDPGTARIGVVGGSNEAIWLEDNDLKPFITVTGAEQLPALLVRKRIDLALMDQRAMNYLQDQKSRVDWSLNSDFVRYAPLHLYVSSRFSADHPRFLSGFNAHLAGCAMPSMQLSEQEASEVQGLAQALMADLSGNINLTNAIYQGPTYDNLTDILTKDTLWQALAPHHPTPLAGEILELPASRAMTAWQASHSPLVTEVLLTDKAGALVAMSRLSSDFWQGDEPKVQEIALETDRGVERKRDMWISPIRYDASTARFQVMVSFPVPLNEPNNGLEGVLVLGLDIEHALNNPPAPGSAE
ncbi:hypothetical protein [Marinobacter nauticus]|uniref:hypothetical protein n=1 Tax=Marinobacter nauticus TaxID=2743 RepID=UPI001C58CDCE|nr:hypothetical protein [Marinobacter nauticus]MBW3197110.1 hypothetical protein [Marinobacter nauticus]MBY6182520.1 hypothetical protein [Marinobacter nauticus]